MTDYHKIYIGAYLKVPKVEKEVDKSSRGCTNNQCEKHGTKSRDTANFCIVCGTPLATVELKEVELVGYWGSAIEAEYEDHLTILGRDNGLGDGSYEILIPNKFSVSSVKFDGDTGEIHYSDDIRRQDVRRFMDRYEAIFERLRRIIPMTDLHAGFLVYYS